MDTPIDDWLGPENSPQPLPGGESRGVVTLALETELNKLPVGTRTSTLAALAMSLAVNIDAGHRVPDSARELRQCLIKLGLEDFEKNHVSNKADELKKRREERRSG